MIDPTVVQVEIAKISGNERQGLLTDTLAVEEPLEIRITFGPEKQRQTKAISVTMRTPGHDFELAAGFLLTEGIVRRSEDIQKIFYCGPETGASRLHNVVRVEVDPSVRIELQRLERNFYTTSSCGICGKTSLDAIATLVDALVAPIDFAVAPHVIHALPEFLRQTQRVFDRTGGLHAAALFDVHGKLCSVREDVGRHNAVDKLIGAELLAGRIPVRDRVLLVSGRASFELLQKAAMAGIPMLAAVGAPSSLAVDLARRFNMTLLGFVRNNRFNIYSGQHRISEGIVSPSTISNPSLPEVMA